MSVTINGTSGLVFSDASTQNTAATGFGFKNRIINGAMMIDQRNAGASVTANNIYTLDRWACGNTQASKYTIQQSSVAPAGFKNSLLVTSSSSYSVGAGDVFFLNQSIEGYNVADFGLGAAGAATFTLSFWVRSSLTGMFGGSLQNSGNARSYPFSYTISAANTWEQKSITVAGDTSGTWLTTNGSGLILQIGLGAGATYSGTAGAWVSGNILSTTGATSVVGTNGATFYITGVQLEKGSTATSFDYRPYSTELALCQRYLPAFSGSGQLGGGGNAVNGSSAYTTVTFPVTTRVAPTGVTVNSAGNFNIGCAGITADFACTSVSASNFSTSGALMLSGVSSGLTGGQVITMRGGASALMYFTGCEL